MNWLTNFVKPKLSSLVGKKETPSDLWTTCSKCNLMLYKSDLEKNLYVCSHCDQHMYVDFDSRFRQLFDEQKYDLIEVPIENTDPLEFKDLKKYTDRLKEAQKKTNQNDAATTQAHLVHQHPDFVYFIIPIGKLISLDPRIHFS